MKKLLTLILALLMLCSCGVQEEPVIEEPQSEAEVLSKSETEIKKYGKLTVEITKASDGGEIIKVFDSEGNRVGIDYTSLRRRRPHEAHVCAYVAAFDGTERLYLYDENGVPYSEEVQAPNYYLLDENGVPVVDIAFEHFEIFENMNIDLRGNSKGNAYDFVKENGELVLVWKDESLESDWGNGFTYTHYYYNSHSWQYGIKKDGKVLFDNLYSGIGLLFGDTILLNLDCLDGRRTFIADENGKILCDKFEYLWFAPFDENSYIGTAGNGVDDRVEYLPVFDENGEPMPNGMWFIDKEGNILSERFEHIELIFNKDKKVPWAVREKMYCAKTAEVTFPDGTKKTIDIAEYARDN